MVSCLYNTLKARGFPNSVGLDFNLSNFIPTQNLCYYTIRLQIDLSLLFDLPFRDPYLNTPLVFSLDSESPSERHDWSHQHLVLLPFGPTPSKITVTGPTDVSTKQTCLFTFHSKWHLLSYKKRLLVSWTRGFLFDLLLSLFLPFDLFSRKTHRLRNYLVLGRVTFISRNPWN